jgi:small nuclear ribonucleoprotein (snRNP)-like protein
VNRVIKTRLHYRLVVTLKDGTTFRGVLWESDKEALVLRDAEALLDPTQAPVGVDGELIILRVDVNYIQRP